MLVDINSRYICKGPIHKLMNQLAACFEFPDSWKGDNESRKGKRNRSEACPAYILNLCCPQSFYDLIFEPSKTDVVFKVCVIIISKIIFDLIRIINQLYATLHRSLLD